MIRAGIRAGDPLLLLFGGNWSIMELPVSGEYEKIEDDFMDEKYTSKPLQLDGASNVRDLGGYPTGNGNERTCFRRLLRGDHLSALTIKDKERIYDYGVRYVVDLRSRMECESRPDALIGWRDVQYCSIPMLDQINSSDFRGQIPDSMGELYISLLEDSRAQLSEVMRRILEAGDKGLLFHCTAGKDRTGVVAMLMLKLAGVSDDDVIRDYHATERYMAGQVGEQVERLRAAGVKVPDHVFGANPADMLMTLEHLRQTYGSAEQYLKTLGLSGEEIAELKQKLHEK